MKAYYSVSGGYLCVRHAIKRVLDNYKAEELEIEVDEDGYAYYMRDCIDCGWEKFETWLAKHIQEGKITPDYANHLRENPKTSEYLYRHDLRPR